MLKKDRQYRKCAECQALRRRTLKVNGVILCAACRRERRGWPRGPRRNNERKDTS
jgi:hypothetical protein